jgi:hypothetical protein
MFAAAGLHNRVLKWIIPAEAGTLTAQSASFGWFSSTKLGGLALLTHSGQTLLEVPALTLDRSILSLALDRADLGKVSLEGPALHVQVDAQGSNLEEFIARYADARRERRAQVSCEVDVRGGAVHIAHKASDDKTAIAVEQLALRADAGNLVALRAALASSADAAVDTREGQGGHLDVSLSTRADLARQLDVAADQWPIEPLTPWLARFIDQVRVSGKITAESSTVWAAGENSATLESTGTATLADFGAQSPALAGDTLFARSVKIPWKIRSKSDRVFVDELAINSDVGEVSAQGELPLTTSADKNENWAVAAMRAPLVATGTLDLARLAAVLPSTLRIREGVHVTSGRAEFSVQSRPSERAHQWSGSLTVSDLAAQDGGRALHWNEPVVVSASIREDNDWTLERLTCQSDFLQIAAQGNRQELDAQIDLDIARLAEELGQFIELEDWQLGGRGSLRVAWRPSQEGPLHATASGSVSGLRFVDPSGRLFSEPSLQLDALLEFTLPTQSRPLELFRPSQVTVRTDKERITVRLDGPEAWSAAAGDAPIHGHIEAEGDLSRWADRLAPWIALAPFRVAGMAKLQTPVEYGGGLIKAQALQLELANLQAVGPGWRIQEPLVTVQSSSEYDLAEGVLTIGDTELVGTSVSLAARNTSLALGGDGRLPQFRGEATFRAALERIDAWRIGSDGRPIPIRPAGMMVGVVRLDNQPEGPRAELTATVSDLTIYEYVAAPAGRQSGYRPGWQEEQLELAAQVGYRRAADEWTIEQAAIRSKSLAAAVAGTVSDVTGSCVVNLRGSIDYDLSDVGPVIAASLGLDMMMSGRDQATFDIAGPLLSPDASPRARMVTTSGPAAQSSEALSRRLTGQAAAGWDSIHLFGLPIGAGRVEAQFRDGIVSFVPLNVSVGSAGRLTAAPVARLAPPPRELALPAGNVIRDVEITPEVSDKLLKYFIPAVADAIETQGEFSLSTDGARMPLDAPAALQSAGQLTVHSMRVRPGRMGREWILLAEQIEAVLKDRQLPQLVTRPAQDWLTIDEQVVNYRVENARVHHENLTFKIGEVEVRSRGSVGFDQSLAIDIDVPVQDKWIEGRPWLVGFRGRTIRGTIRGTFGNLDRGTLLGDLSRQLLEGAAAGAIEEGLNRALDRLLRPRE